jgi:hypothetical protein
MLPGRTPLTRTLGRAAGQCLCTARQFLVSLHSPNLVVVLVRAAGMLQGSRDTNPAWSHSLRWVSFLRLSQVPAIINHINTSHPPTVPSKKRNGVLRRRNEYDDERMVFHSLAFSLSLPLHFLSLPFLQDTFTMIMLYRVQYIFRGRRGVERH